MKFKIEIKMQDLACYPFKEVRKITPLTFLHGYSYKEFYREVLIWYPFPFNWIIRWGKAIRRKLEFLFLHSALKYGKEERGYMAGLKEGRERGFRGGLHTGLTVGKQRGFEEGFRAGIESAHAQIREITERNEKKY